MSHLATVSVKIYNLDALERASQKCGLEFRRGQTQFRWFAGKSTPCEHALVVPNNSEAYEIGVCRVENAEGRDEWVLRYDAYKGGRGMQDYVATAENPGGVGRLLYHYAFEVESEVAAANGFMLQEQEQEDGSMLLVCSR